MVNHYLFLLFKCNTKHVVRNYYYHAFIIIIEYLPIISIITISLQSIQQLLRPNIQFNVDIYRDIIYYYSLTSINYEHNTITMNDTFAIIPLVIYFLFCCLCFVSLHKKNHHIKEKKCKIWNKNAKKICFTFFDTLVFRCFNIYLIQMILYSVILTPNNNNFAIQAIIIVISVVYLVMYLLMMIRYYSLSYIIIQLNNINYKYPYDTFSSNYDMILFIIKVLICSRNCVLSQKKLMLSIDIVITVSIIIHGFYTMIHINQIVINRQLNLVRAFFPVFNCLYVILYAFFGSIYSLPLLLLIMICLVILTIILIHNIELNQKNRLLRNKERIEPILYLIDDLMNMKYNKKDYFKSHQSKDYQLMITKLITYHQIHCSDKKCKICNYNLYKTKNDESLKQALIEIVFKENYCQTIKQKTMMYDLIQLIFSNDSSIKHNIKTSYYYHKLLSKYEGKNTNVQLNILLHNHFFLKAQKEDIERIVVIENLIILSNQINTLIKVFKQLLFIKERTPLSFVTSSLVIKKLKSILKENCIYKNDFDQNYHYIIICYILEILLNTRLKHHSGMQFDITVYNDFLTENYTGYNYIVLHHQLNTKLFKVQNSGKEFSKYINQNFDNMFFKDFQEELLNNFITYLKNYREMQSYEFPIKDSEKPQFVQSMFVRFLPLPSIDNKSLLINGIYKHDYEDLIIFTEDHNKQLCYLSHYSRRLENILVLSIETLLELNKNRKHIDFNTLFTLSDKEEMKYTINFKVFYKQLLKYSTFDISYVDQMKSQMNSKVTHYIEKQIIKGKKVSYRIFKGWKGRRVMNDITKQYDSNQLVEEEDEFDKYLFAGSVLTHMNSTTYTASVSSGSTLYSQKKGFASSTIKSVNEINEENKKRNNSSFKKFTIIIFGFDIILVFISIIYLIVDLNATSNYQAGFNIESEILSLEIKYLHSNLNFFGNMCLDGPNNNDCIDYFQNFNDILFPKKDFNIRLYFFSELRAKSDIIKDVITTLKAIIYGYNNQDLINILEETVDFVSLTKYKNQINIYQQRISFLDALQRYGNMLSLIIADSESMNEPIFIFEIIDDQIILINEYPEPYTIYQMTIYEFTINYLMYLQMFDKFKDGASMLVQTSVQYKKLIANFFPFFLLGAHFFLFFFCILFIFKYETLLETIIQEMMRNISNESSHKYFLHKIKLVKQLSMFFDDNPLKLIKELTGNYHSMKQQKLDTQNEFIESKIYFEKKYYKQVTTKERAILLVLFCVYLIYVIIFYFVTTISIDNYIEGENYILSSAKITSAIFSGVGLMNVILLTNRSDQTLNKIVNNNSTIGIIESLLHEVYQATSRVTILENLPYVPILNDELQLPCNVLFRNLNDSVIENTLKTKEHYAALEKICNYYNLMQYENEVILVHDIGMRLHDIVNQIEIGNKEKMYESAHSLDYYSLMTLTLVVLRPIRTFYLSAFYPTTVQNIITSNNTTSITFLILNIAIEIIMLLIIKLIIINSLVKKNCSLFILNKCFKA